MKIATLISALFEPAILLCVAFIVRASSSGLSVLNAIGWMMVIVGPTILYRLWAKKTRGLDWDMHERKNRIKPFLLLLGYLVIIGIGVGVFEPRLISVLALFFFWSVGFLLITAYWTKISGHVGGDMLTIGMILQSYGSTWWPIVFIIPLVAWARVVRKDHTVEQVVLGAAYSTVVLYIFSLTKGI